ncbi:MAG: metal-dependent hydrolase [Sphingomonadales bacterium 32-68-7]|nr:MAG: metal-dependent hydrolase [Sphingomonadales bacterium 12-68-11]OYX08763.1 MAG: metal-dependent hydrolase [Sphingomonadales bacterium 32-68-7]
MDNLTHSFVGALIGQAGLKRRTGLAMPALIIGANIPDIDATCTIYGIESLAMRRGLTHGPIAWVLLPLVLAGLLYGWDHLQARRGKRPEGRLPVHFGWLYALSLIGCLTHPGLDWMNSYGIRLLEPFSSEWFYGDVLFIIDLWLWLGLGFATWLSLRREKRGGEWQRPARIGLAGALAYIGLNAAITWRAEARAVASAPYPAVAIANEVPVAFWRRELVTGQGDGLWQTSVGQVGDLPLDRCDLAAARDADPRVDAFLFWSRAPFVERAGEGWLLRDARFAASLGTGRFSVQLPPDTCR